MMEWKKDVFLHGLRERIIRGRLRVRGQPDMLYDVPQSDPRPLHFLSSRIPQDQLDVVAGVVCLPGDTPLPARTP